MTFKCILKKLTAFLVLFILTAGLLPALPSRAAENEEATERGIFVNPLYADILSEKDVEKALPAQEEKRGAKAEDLWEYAPEGETPELCTTLAEAADVLREGIKLRLDAIPIYTAVRMTPSVGAILTLAKAHTGDPIEGDYIAWQYGGGRYENVKMLDRNTGEILYYRLTYTIYYYTTAEQETAMNEAVFTTLEALGTAAMTEPRDIIRAVYDYVCANVVYDHEHLDDNTYQLQFTAYAALVQGTAVCQGYSLLIYRLLLENGIDCRVVTGSNHAWNIVQIGDLYYYADSTWDAGDEYYAWYLRGSNYFSSHYPDDRSRAFLQDYSIFEGIGRTSIIGFDFTASGIRITWEDVDDAEFYVVERQELSADGTPAGEWTELAVTAETQTLDSNTTFGVQYSYQVRPAVTVFTDEPCNAENVVRRPFNDVPETASFASAVSWAVSQGIVRGTGETTFSPYSECERYQFAVMLYKLAGQPAVNDTNCPFTDVTEDDTFYRAVVWAYNRGIISGTSKTKFSPHGIIKRYQAVQMLYKMAGKPTVNVSNRFTDVREDSSYYRAVLWAVKKGITSGTTATTFSPEDPCLRYQMAVFLYRYVQRIGL